MADKILFYNSNSDINIFNIICNQNNYLKESSIFVSGDLLVGLLKVEYKYNIDLKDVSFVEVQQRDYKFSSRGREKRGRGIETYRIGHKFIEFNYLDGSVKRIHCNDLSRKQINKILEHCKNKKNYY